MIVFRLAHKINFRVKVCKTELMVLDNCHLLDYAIIGLRFGLMIA